MKQKDIKKEHDSQRMGQCFQETPSGMLDTNKQS